MLPGLLLLHHAASQVPCELCVWRLAREQSVADGLLELARLRDADTLVCGIAGYSTKKLGSVSYELTRNAVCNTIVVKVPAAWFCVAFGGPSGPALVCVYAARQCALRRAWHPAPWQQPVARLPARALLPALSAPLPAVFLLPSLAPSAAPPCLLHTQDPHEARSNQAATSGAVGLSTMVLPASKDLSRVSRGLERTSVDATAGGGGIKAHHGRSPSHAQ